MFSGCRRNGSRRTLSECERFCLLSVCACSVHAPKARRFKPHPPQAASKKQRTPNWCPLFFGCRSGIFHCPSENIVEMRASALTLILGFISRYFRYTLRKNDTQSFFLAYPRPSDEARLPQIPPRQPKEKKLGTPSGVPSSFGCGSGI